MKLRKVLTTVFLLLITLMAHGQKETDMQTFDPTFAHMVYFWLKNPDSAADRAAFETAIGKLMRDSQYSKTNFLGKPPKAVRGVVDDSFTYAFVLTFASAADQEAYQTEPVHLKFIEEAEHLWDKVQVYDAEGIEK